MDGLGRPSYNSVTQAGLFLNHAEKTGELTDRYEVDNFHAIKEGKNGGGNRWYTDGKLIAGVIKQS